MKAQQNEGRLVLVERTRSFFGWISFVFEGIIAAATFSFRVVATTITKTIPEKFREITEAGSWQRREEEKRIALIGGILLLLLLIALLAYIAYVLSGVEISISASAQALTLPKEEKIPPILTESVKEAVSAETSLPLSTILQASELSIVGVTQEVACAGKQTEQMQSHTGIALHHTAHSEDKRQGPYRWVEAYVNKGATHAPYHFLVANGDGIMPTGEAFEDGTVWQLQELEYRSVHTGTPFYRFNYIAIAIDDNLSKRHLTEAAHQSLIALLRWLCNEHDIPPANIKGHREFNSTECPGEHVDLDAIRREVAQAATEFPLTFSAYPYDEGVLVEATETMLAQYNSPIRGYGRKIIAECKKWDVDPAFFMGNLVEESHAGKAYVGRKVGIDGVEYDFLEYFHNIIGYKPRNTPEEVKLQYHRFASWDEMVEFWPRYIRTKYFNPETSFTGQAMGTLGEIQPIYGPSAESWIEDVVTCRNRFLTLYNQILAEKGANPAKKVVWHSNALMFHGIGEGTEGIPKAQHENLLLDLQAKGYTFVSLKEVIAAFYEGTSLPEKWVLLTYDDGRVDFYTNAYPFLKEHNFPAVIFVPTETRGLTDEQLREIANDGLIAIGAHSRTHPHSSVLSDPDVSQERLEGEIKGSKEDLEAIIGKPVLAFAWPGGGHGPRAEEYAKEVGFKIAFAVWGPEAQERGDLFRLGRFGVQPATDVVAQIKEIEQLQQGAKQ